MTNKEHLDAHLLLHKKLDELLADYIADTEKLISQTSCMELLQWSKKQIDELKTKVETVLTVYKIKGHIMRKDSPKSISLNVAANDTETAIEKFKKHIKEKYNTNLNKKDIESISYYTVVSIDLI